MGPDVSAAAAKLPSAVGPYLRGLRHVGVVTEDSETLVVRLQTLFGLKEADIHRLPPPGVATDTRFVFLSLGGVPFEIIEPVTERFRQLLLSSGRGINHVCFNVSDLEGAVAAMRSQGVRLGHVTRDGPVTMPSFHMAYFNPEDTGGLLIEFVEPRT